MQKIRTTITISVAFNSDIPQGKSPEEACRQLEEAFRTNMDDKIRLVLAMAKGPNGTIQWSIRPTRERLAEGEPKEIPSK